MEWDSARAQACMLRKNGIHVNTKKVVENVSQVILYKGELENRPR